mmetsp:Transcript_24817/g.59029  ORF Transcript_24817/g.59029 Transcript_24817/m.59029 type:complete len:415 (+) Transcript_24817:169-1413(+)
MSKSQKELAFAKAFGRLQGGSNGRTAESEEQDLDQELWDGDGCDIKPWHPLHTPAKIPEDEEDRLLALEALGVIDTPPEDEFDILAKITKLTFGSDSAAINFVDAEMQWTKACEGVGRDRDYLDRDISFCAHTILSAEPLIVLNATEDDRFKFSDVVTGTQQIKFYAGAPIIITDIQTKRTFGVGSLCVTDTNSRDSFSAEEIKMLQTLAGYVVVALEKRAKERERAKKEATVAPEPEVSPLEAVEERALVLKKCMAFTVRKVDETCINLIAQKLKPSVHQAGEYLTRKGESGDPMYFLASGSCICTLNGHELERLGKGQCFGEVGIINMCKMKSTGIESDDARTRCVRAADVMALERCEVLALNFEDAWPLMRKVPNLWYTLQDIAKQRMLRVSKEGGGSSRTQSRAGSFRAR